MHQTSQEMLRNMSEQDLLKVDWEEEHSRLHAIVDHLENKVWLTTEEELKLKNVKKQRLQAKDKLRILGRLPE